MSEIFTLKDAWSGGFYELVFKLQDVLVVSRQIFLRALGTSPGLYGCFLSASVEPSEQQALDTQQLPTEVHLLGVAVLANGASICVGSYCNCSDEDEDVWIGLFLPLGSLQTAYPIGSYPFGRTNQNPEHTWMRAVNVWLVSIAQATFDKCQFAKAFIGFDIDAFCIEKEIENGIPKNTGTESCRTSREASFGTNRQSIYRRIHLMGGE